MTKAQIKPKVKKNIKYHLLFFLALISLICSIVLVVSTKCNEQDTCDINDSSNFNYYLGVVLFSFMMVVLTIYIKSPTKNKRIIINIGVIIWSLIAVYFLYLQQFVLHSYCKYCVVIDISGLIALLIIIFGSNLKEDKNGVS